MVIRRFTQNDLHAITQMDSFAALQIRRHGGLKPENIYCTIDGGRLTGFGFLILNYGIARKGRHIVDFYINLGIKSTEKESSDIMDVLISRFDEIKNLEPEQHMCLRICCGADEVRGIQFFLDKKFILSGVIPVFARSLSDDIPLYSPPNGVSIQELRLTSQNMEMYLGADFISSEDLSSEAAVWFQINNPSHICNAAFYKKKLIGAVSFYDTISNKSACENIFVIPEFRKSGVGKALLSASLNTFKALDKKQTSMSLPGKNLPALRLCLSCGYSLDYNLLELLYQ